MDCMSGRCAGRIGGIEMLAHFLGIEAVDLGPARIVAVIDGGYHHNIHVIERPPFLAPVLSENSIRPGFAL